MPSTVHAGVAILDFITSNSFMSHIRLIQIYLFTLLIGLMSMASAEIRVQIRLGPDAVGEDWYQMAVWLEDSQGHYKQSLYVTDDVGRKGLGNGFWRVFGLTLREVPESLPVWAHRRGVLYGKSYYPPKEKPLPDTITGATIKQPSISRTFDLNITAEQNMGEESWRCLLELNVSRDGIPSMVFQANTTIDSGPERFRFMGFGDQQGRNGELHTGDASPTAFLQEASCTISKDQPGQVVP